MTHQPSSRALYIPRMTTVVLVSVLAAVSIAVASISADQLAGHTVHPNFGLDDFVAGTLGGTLVYCLQMASRRRRIEIRNRMTLIQVANREIHQALGIILDYCPADLHQREVMARASDHIEWVLREVLPTMTDNKILQLEDIPEREEPVEVASVISIR